MCRSLYSIQKKKNVIETFFFFCNFAFAVNKLTGNVSRGLPQLCKLPCINMQQNASAQSDKINAKVKISIANTFLTHCFSWYARQPDKKQKQFEMRVYGKNQNAFNFASQPNMRTTALLSCV